MGAISDSQPDLWLEADSLGLSDGASVSSWSDSSGNGYTATQGTSGNQPIYKTNITPIGKPVVRFDGSNDYLTSLAPTDANGQTVIAVAKATAFGAFPTLRGSSTAGGLQFRYASTGKLNLVKQDVTDIGVSTTASSTSAFEIVVGRWTDGGNLDATASSVFDSTTVAYNAVGGGTTAVWLSSATPSSGTPQWLRVRPRAVAYVATSVKIYSRASRTGNQAKDFTIEGSNDGSSWTTLDTRTGISWVSAETKTFSFSNSTAYKYYRVNCTATQGATALEIAEIELNSVTFGSSGGAYYRNGTADGTVTPASIPPFITGNTTNIGRNGSGNNQYLTGDIAALLSWSRELTSTEISDITAELSAKWITGTPVAASATLTASSTLTADAFIGSPTGSGSANLTASSTLTAAASLNRAATATLTSTSTLTAAGQLTLQQAVAPLTATSTLTATAAGAAVSSASAALYAASALFVEATTSKAIAASLTATSTLTAAATAFTPWVEPNDPRTGKPQYRLIVAHRDGTRYAEITDATTSPIEDGVGVGATFSFTMATNDPKMSYVSIPATQAQVWRGTGIPVEGGAGKPEFRGPMVKATDDTGGATTIDCRDPMWYLESGRRVIGAIPKRDLLVNGSFATGEPPWAGGFEPDSIPAAQPARSVIDVDFFGTRMKALQISGVDKVVTVTKEVNTEAVFVPNSATYLPGGDSAIRAVAGLMPKTGALQVRVDGYTADNRINGDPGDGMALSLARANAAKATILGVRPSAVVTTSGHGYYNQIPGGQAANRRVVITWNGVQEASGHKQYEGQTLTVTQPVANKAYLPLTAVIWVKITKWIGPSKDGRGLYLQIVDPAKPTVVVDSGVFSIDENTPRDRWIRMEASLDKGVPANGIGYTAQVRLYPPAGTALFTRGGLYPGDQLAFFDVDQALIIQGLVQHAQDTTIGKGALGITTRCQPTGITRTREYPYDERMEIDTAINEIAALYAGPEVVMEVTDIAQTVVTYHPRQGVTTGEVLVHGGNVVAYEAPTDTRDAASSIILQADGSGADREEGYARDVAALDGLLLERVISTENETPVTELQEGATEALAKYKQPRPAIWVTVDPSQTGAVLAKIRQGDTARLVIENATIDGTFRRVKRRLYLNDVLELMLSPEG